jgi:nucleotide-binding universal stress UspA family protein
MTHILVPLDGSSLAADIVPYVRTLAANLSASIHLMHVVSDIPRHPHFDHHHLMLWQHDSTLLQEGRPDIGALASLRQHAESYLREQAQPLQDDGFDVKIDVHFGEAAVRIAEVAATTQPAMIAMVSHGYSGLRRWTLGSVTEKVVHATSIPVFVVRHQEGVPPLSNPTIRRVLVPLDGSAFARQALPVAAELATHTNATLHLMCAVPLVNEFPALVRASLTESMWHDVQAERRSEAEQNLVEVATDLQGRGLKVSTQVANGRPAEKISEVSMGQQCDIIVMATHGYSGLQQWALGSIASKVLHSSPVPLLLVHAQE